MKRIAKVLLAGWALTSGLQARPYIPDLADVPIGQLLTRYEKRLAQEPADAHNHYVLGRLNAMAYATGCKQFKVKKDDGQAYFGALDPGYPPRPPAARNSNSAHLKKAVREYARAVELKPDDLAMRLGYAWTLDQSGRRVEAIQQYRKVFQAAYRQESSKNGLGVFAGLPMTEETGQYLLALLDSKRDASEIAEISSKIKEVEKIPRAITPILIPLQRGTALEQLVNPGAGVKFDLDGSGRRRKWGWITPRAGWLVYLRKRQTVTSGLQMMGSVAFWIFWRDGYQAMAALDQNGDGWLRDGELRNLKVWNDQNSDGNCRPSELRELSELGIVALSTHSQPLPAGKDRVGEVRVSPGGVRYRDGRGGESYDWSPVARP